MTIRQKLFKLIYPLFIRVSQISGNKVEVLKNEKRVKPTQSIYDLSVPLNSGGVLSLKQFAGKKMLLVNTASDCGYTDQYDDLQQLYIEHRQNLVVIGFPANDFKQQEKGSDEEIAQFCRMNYGISFPLSKKSVVIKSAEQNPVFRWLTDQHLNGWNDKPPTWNFSKYLVNEEGVLTHYFDPAVSPLNPEILKQLW